MLPTVVLRVFAVVALSAATSAIPYEECGSLYTLLSVDMDACTTAPCDLIVGNNVNMVTNFYAVFTSTKLRLEAFYVINNIYIPATVKSDPCSASTCEVVQGETKSYNVQLAVNHELPPVESELVWRLYNENSRMIVCYKVAVRLLYST